MITLHKEFTQIPGNCVTCNINMFSKEILNLIGNEIVGDKVYVRNNGYYTFIYIPQETGYNRIDSTLN